jgi:hypothetical protein
MRQDVAKCNFKIGEVCAMKSFIHEINPLNAELNSICHFLALLGVHRSSAEILGSNPTGGMDICLL